MCRRSCGLGPCTSITAAPISPKPLLTKPCPWSRDRRRHFSSWERRHWHPAIPLAPSRSSKLRWLPIRAPTASTMRSPGLRARRRTARRGALRLWKDERLYPGRPADGGNHRPAEDRGRLRDPRHAGHGRSQMDRGDAVPRRAEGRTGEPRCIRISAQRCISPAIHKRPRPSSRRRSVCCPATRKRSSASVC